MPKKRKLRNISYLDKGLLLATLLLISFGTLMIVSAEMGELAGNMSIITSTLLRQVIYLLIGVFAMFFVMRLRFKDFTLQVYYVAYAAVVVLLLSTRLFGATNGAYAWIRFGPLSIQPSEFAKVFVLVYGSKLLAPNRGVDNIKYFKYYTYSILILFAIIFIYQKDTGSAVVLFLISYVIAALTPHKETVKIRFYMFIGMILVIILTFVALSPLTYNFLLKHSDNYMIGRFLAAANPFEFMYDTGYHLIMGMVSFANGGWFGLGYGKSIHKYMNFPNPSNDFILPVIVEELGIVFGLLPILLLYGIIFYKLIKYSTVINSVSSKMIICGTFVYLAVHFFLNVGGVSGLIPLTGVPLLMVSSGGSSLMATLMAIGLCQHEIIEYRKKKDEE